MLLHIDIRRLHAIILAQCHRLWPGVLCRRLPEAGAREAAARRRLHAPLRAVELPGGPAARAAAGDEMINFYIPFMDIYKCIEVMDRVFYRSFSY